jgi:hypothetical protein
MTNMDGVGLAFMIVLVGVPILCVGIIAGWLAHRSAVQKDTAEGRPEAVDVNTTGMIRDLLLRPDTFFRTVSEGPDTLFAPVLWLFAGTIVLSLGVMAAVALHFFTSGIANVLFLTLVALVLMTFSTVLAWIASSGVAYLISHLFHGSGSFRKTLQNTGYGLAPGLVLYGLVLLLGTLALAALQVPVVPVGPPAPGNQMLSLIGRAGVLIASLWVFVLMTYGLRHTRNISFRQAVVSAGVPVLLFLVFVNLQYLGPA